LFASVIVFICFSCVPASHLYELRQKNELYKSERDSLWVQNKKLEVQVNELERQTEMLSEEVESLMMDSIQRSLDIRRLRSELENLTRRYENMQETHEALAEGSTREVEQVLEHLQEAQEELQSREDSLIDLEMKVDSQAEELNEMQNKLESCSQQLYDYEEAQERRESAINELLKEVENALGDIVEEGFEVRKSQGKVYAETEKQHFFYSDTMEISSTGYEIVEKINNLLEDNPSVKLHIEVSAVHVPEHLSTSVTDVWDYSARVAGALSRTLVNESAMAERITAGGREKHRANRTNEEDQENAQQIERTEILLIFETDKLFEEGLM